MQILPIYPDGFPRLALEETDPLDTFSQCQRCTLHGKARTVCMSPEIYGDESKGVLLVHGQGPGQEEDRHGRPNIGASGQYLRKALEGTWPGAVVFDNAVRCAPGIVKITDKMVTACRPYVAQTWRESNAKRILCLGASAINSVVGRSFPPMSVRRGYTYTSTGTPVFFLMHPVNGLRNRFLRQWFEEDLGWALTANPPGPPVNAAAYLVETAEDARIAVEDLEIAGSASWDLETFGPICNSEVRVLNLAITPQDCEYAYVLDHKVLYDQAISGPLLDQLARMPSGGANIKFDSIMLRALFGRSPNITFDVQIWRRLLSSDSLVRLEHMQSLVGMAGGKDEVKPYITTGAKELRKLAKKSPKLIPDTFDIPQANLNQAVERVRQGEEPKRYAYAAIPPKIRSLYNARDTISTERLRALLQGDMDKRPDLFSVWDKVMVDLNYAITCMEHNGIAVDRASVAHLQSAMAARIAEISARFVQFGPDFNPNSSPQVGKLLFERLRLKHSGRTPTGQYSATEAVLKKLHNPVADDILAFRKASHFKSQYADGMAFFIRDDGRIHPGFKISGTGTGRPSCEEPNLLNIPRAKTPEGKMCRDIFVASPGCVLMEADYSQVELRVAAMLSGDEVMIQFFKDGADFHLETAKLIAPFFGLDPETITKEHPLRDQAKIVNFATLYGDPPAGLAARLGTSKQMAVKLQNAILGQFKKLKKWIDSQLQFTRLHGHTRTWWDGVDFRERSLWGVADGDEDLRLTAERSAWNTTIQGTAAEYTNASLGKIQHWLDDDFVPSKLVLTVYDSIIQEVDERVVDEVAGRTREIMTDWPVLHNMPIEVDIKVGHSWGGLEGYSE